MYQSLRGEKTQNDINGTNTISNLRGKRYSLQRCHVWQRESPIYMSADYSVCANTGSEQLREKQRISESTL